MSDLALGMLDVEKLSTILSHVFQDTPSQAEADAILGEIAELLDEERAIGFTIDPFSLRITVGASVGFRREEASDFLDRFATIDPWLKELLRTRTVGSVVAAHDLPAMVAKAEGPQSDDLCRELLARQIHGCAGAIIREEEGALVCICIYSPRPKGLPQTMLGLLRLLVRQLGFNASLHQQRMGRDLERRLLRTAVDLCQMPVVIVDGRGQIVLGNAAVRTLLNKGDVIQVKAGRLAGVNGAEASRLAAQIARVTAAAADDLTATWQSAGGDGGRMVAMISTLRLDELNQASGPTYAFISFTELGLKDDRSLAPGLLSEMFGLTDAEERVARLIESGQSAATVAEQTGLSLATIRTHLSRIYEKTETATQAELVRVLTLLGPFKTANPHLNGAAVALAAALKRHVR